MNNLVFEEIRDEHLPEVQEIYNYFVVHTTVSFHTDPLSLDEIRVNVMNVNPRYKTFVISQNGSVQGYFLITQFKNKQAYNVTGEVTIYLKPDCVGQGIGGRALTFIEDVAITNGFQVLIATICTENEKSKHLFEKRGYVQCAHFKEIGYKFGRKLDIASYQKILS